MISKRQKTVLLTIILLSLLLGVAGLSYAWYVNSRGVATIAKIQSPGVMYISGGHGETIPTIQLSYSDANVDADGTVHVRNVICIGSDSPKFELEIAHTTNIQGLIINIYPAIESKNPPTQDQVAENIKYVQYTYKGTDYYYYRDVTSTGYYSTNITESEDTKLIPMQCLNRGDGQKLIATGSGAYHNDTYGEGETRVQKNAEPLYWLVMNANENPDKSSSILELPHKQDVFKSDLEDFNYEYAKFYIIEGIWNENDKETDIVNIMVNSVTTSN